MTRLEAILQVSLVVAVTRGLVTSIAAVISQVAEVVIGDAGTGGGAVEGVRGTRRLRVANCTRHKFYIVDRHTRFISLCRLSYELDLKRSDKSREAKNSLFTDLEPSSVVAKAGLHHVPLFSVYQSAIYPSVNCVLKGQLILQHNLQLLAHIAREI